MSFDYWSKRRMQYFLEKIRNVLGSAAYKNVPTTGDAGVTQVVLGNDSRLSDARTPVAHNQASNTINAMTGYSKPLSTSAITTSDTLNSAIGKLETALDGLSGSEILILHLSEDEGTGDTVCDKTPSEVLAAYQAGKVLFLLDTEYDYLYLFESYSDYDDHYIISFSKCEARYSGLIDVKTYNLTSSEDTDTWDDIDYDDTDLEFAHVEISLSNGNYTCDASPTEMSLALQYRDSLGVFLQYTEDDTVYNVSYADFTNNIYHFSTVIKDASNNFKLRTFVLTASGSSWGSITMNEVSIGSVEVVDNLTTNDGTKALSAKQGKVLNDTKQNNIWHGTTAEYTAQASSIPDGTIVDITDDTESVPQIEIVDNLTTQDATKALSAKQGYVLKGLIDGKSDVFLITMTEDENDNTSYVVDKTFEEILAAVEAGKFVMLKYDYSETNEDEEYHEEYDYRNYYTLTSTENYNYYDDEDESNNYFTYEFDFNSYEYHDGHNLKYTAINGLDLSYDSYDESWFVTKYQDAEDYSSVGQIWIYNNEYQCSLNPNALRCAVLSKFSTIFLRCTVDNTIYHLTYADTINNVYYFSTIIKDNSDNFKLRTFVLTASGVSWTSITMNEVAIGGSSGNELQAIELTSTEYSNLSPTDKNNPLKLYFTTSGSVAKEWDGGYEQLLPHYHIWTDGTNTYYSSGSSQYKLNGLNWEPMTWSGLTSFDGQDIWSDGTNIYYSYNTNQYKLNSTTWESMTWTGLTDFKGRDIFAKGSDVYYIANTSYKLNGTTWETITWTGTYTPSNASDVWTDGTNIYYSFGTFQSKLNGTTWESMTWTGLTNFDGDRIWTDGTDIYCSDYSTQKKLNGTSWESITWTGKTSFSGQYVWTDGTDVYYDSGYKLNGTTWERIYRYGISPLFYGKYIWTDGTNIYYSENDLQFKLNKNVWEPITWTGLTSLNGTYIWTDETNIYYSNGSSQYKLNGTAWETMSWTGFTNIYGSSVWTDGTDIYYSSDSNQYKLNGTTWTSVSWTGLTSFDGSNIWSDGENIYYSYDSTQYKLNGTAWETMSWTGLTSFKKKNIWTDGTDFYYSDGSSSTQYKLNGTSWESTTWTGYSGPKGEDIWTDGTNIYYSFQVIHYRLDGTTWSMPPYIDQSNEGTLYYKDRNYTGQGGGGSSTFAGLSDVDFDNLQNGQVPVYNSTTQKWENGSGGSGASSISQLTDVTLTNLANDDILVKKTSGWENISGYKRIIPITLAAYELLTTEQKNADDIIWDITDITEVDLSISDTTTSNNSTWSSNKISSEIGFYTEAVSGSTGDTYVDITDARISDDNINVIEPLFLVPSGSIIGVSSVVLDADGESPHTITVTFINALTEDISVYLHVTILGEDES